MRPTILALPLLFALSSLPAADGCGAANGACHLPRWEPATIGGTGHGETVELEGNTALVAALDESCVYVYTRTGSHWHQTQIIDDPHAGNNRFGYALELDGDELFIGAPYDGTHATESGAVHEYERVGGSFQLVTTYYAAAPEAYADFGWSLARDGDWLAIGSPGEAGLGRVHTYLRLPEGWASLWSLLGPEWGFGRSLAVRTLADPLTAQVFIGSPSDDTKGNNAGAVHAFYLWPGGWATGTPVRPAELSHGHWFGADVAFDGEELFVSAPGDDDAGPHSGAVYVFDVEGGPALPTITKNAKLLPCGGSLDFGGRIDREGDRLVVGAPSEGSGETPGGATYVYRPGLFGGWALEERLQAHGGTSYDGLGYDVAVSGDAVLAGAPWHVTGGTSGGAYLFSLTPKQQPGGPCPCDTLGGVESFGDGKPGSNGVPVLEGSVPVPGESNLIGLKNALVGAQPVLVWGLTQVTSGFDGGELHVGDPHLAVLPPIGVIGQVGIGWDVPSDPAFCGLDLFAQAFFIDPGAAGPLHTAQSNALRLTIGY